MMKKKKSGGGGANWMDTYGDMVTLLLCFFVMLYSMSNMDKDKWIALVQSINPNAVTQAEQGSSSDTANTQGMTQEEVDANMEEIYQALTQYVQTAGLTDQVSVSKGSGYVFVSFDDAVFFDGNSYELRDEGKVVLDEVAKPLAEASQSINEVDVYKRQHQDRAHARG